MGQVYYTYFSRSCLTRLLGDYYRIQFYLFIFLLFLVCILYSMYRFRQSLVNLYMDLRWFRRWYNFIVFYIENWSMGREIAEDEVFVGEVCREG